VLLHQHVSPEEYTVHVLVSLCCYMYLLFILFINDCFSFFVLLLFSISNVAKIAISFSFFVLLPLKLFLNIKQLRCFSFFVLLLYNLEGTKPTV